MVYIGSSADSYVACLTIEPAEWKQKGAVDHFGLKNLSGLNLVSFLLSVHYISEFQKIIQKHIEQSTYPIKTPKDGQALLIQGKKVIFLGENDRE